MKINTEVEVDIPTEDFINELVQGKDDLLKMVVIRRLLNSMDLANLQKLKQDLMDLPLVDAATVRALLDSMIAIKQGYPIL